jgi:hypothetical protein
MTQIADSVRPSLGTQLATTLSLRNERLFLAMLVLTLGPIWIGRYLPLVDMPQHAAQITALRELWHGNESLAQLFEINWFTPYLFGYLLLYAVSSVLPIMIATKLVVSLAVVAIPLATQQLLRAAGADERWKWLAIPASFSFAFYWGFLSYLVAAPLALIFLVRTVRFMAAPTIRNAVGIAVFSLLLFFCHVIVLGLASLLALGYVAGVSYRNPRALLLRSLPYATPLPVIAVWLVVTYRTTPSVHSDPIVFPTLFDRLLQLLLQPAGQDGSSLLVALLVTAAVLALPPLSGAKFNRRPERWLPLALAMLVFMVAPHFVLSTAYFYQRLGLFLVPLWLMTWDAPSGPARRLDWVAMLVVLIWAGATIGRFAGFSRETESFRQVTAAVEPQRRVASMVYDARSPFFVLPVYLHFPVWYAATERGVVDFNFADFFSQMVRYKADAGPRMTDFLGWYPTEFDWQAHGGAHYDYFLVKSSSDISLQIFKDKRGSVELVAQSGWWWLYRNLERAPPAASR